MQEKKKILIVEDDVFISDIYQTKFAQEGFEVLVATDGLEAMKILEHEVPDIVLLDVMMPNMNGMEVLREIKISETLQKIPVILLTNISQSEQVAESKQYGADEYLVKSNFTPSDIVEKVNALLNV